MDKNLLVIKDNDVFVGTWKLSKGFEVEHRALKRLVKRYQSEFEELGFVATPLQQIDSKKRGRQVEEYLLNEPQATYITTLLTNNSIVRKFKLHLTKEFFRQRKLLALLLVQKQNAEWYEKRASGKIERRLETDAIQEFIEYAKAQGSESADKYYMVISKMENAALFHLELLTQKFPNIRDVVEGFQLDSLKMADRIVGRTLKEGMKNKIPYKEIYQIAKTKVESFAEAIGRSPIQIVLNKKEIHEIQKMD